MGDRAAVRVQIVDRESDLRALEPSWWALLGRAVHAQPTMTPAWMSTWWRVFGSMGGRELRVVAIRSGGELVALVPLLRRWALRDRMFPLSTLELVATGEAESDEIFSELVGPIVAAGYEECAARAFAGSLARGELGSWDEVCLSAMSSTDPMLPHLAEALRAIGAIVQVRATMSCPYIELPPSWDEYLALLDRDKRYFVRRTLRDFETWAGPGGMKVEHVEGPADVARGWQILRALHGERWRGEGAFGRDRFARFHDLLVHRLIRERGGGLELSWLVARGEPVAVLYNIVHRGVVHFYQSGRKCDLPRPVRPGIALHLLAIQRAIRSGHRFYELLARPDRYKQQLCPGTERHLVTLSAVAPTFRARAVHRARRAARTLVETAREASRTWPLLSQPPPAAAAD